MSHYKCFIISLLSTNTAINPEKWSTLALSSAHKFNSQVRFWNNLAESGRSCSRTFPFCFQSRVSNSLIDDFIRDNHSNSEIRYVILISGNLFYIFFAFFSIVTTDYTEIKCKKIILTEAKEQKKEIKVPKNTFWDKRMIWK